MKNHLLIKFLYFTIILIFTACASTSTNKIKIISDCNKGEESQLCTEEDFFKQLKYQVYNNLKYPLEAKNSRLEGIVRVKFVLKNNGEVKSARIIKSSGHDILDQTTIRTIKEKGLFYKIPKSLNKDQLTVKAQINFALEHKTKK